MPAEGEILFSISATMGLHPQRLYCRQSIESGLSYGLGFLEHGAGD